MDRENTMQPFEAGDIFIGLLAKQHRRQIPSRQRVIPADTDASLRTKSRRRHRPFHQGDVFVAGQDIHAERDLGLAYRDLAPV